VCLHIVASDGAAIDESGHRFLLRHDPEKWKPVFRKDHASSNIFSFGHLASKPVELRKSLAWRFLTGGTKHAKARSEWRTCVNDSRFAAARGAKLAASGRRDRASSPP
jgi:hypothetical protein